MFTSIFKKKDIKKEDFKTNVIFDFKELSNNVEKDLKKYQRERKKIITKYLSILDKYKNKDKKEQDEATLAADIFVLDTKLANMMMSCMQRDFRMTIISFLNRCKEENITDQKQLGVLLQQEIDMMLNGEQSIDESLQSSRIKSKKKNSKHTKPEYFG